MRHIVVRTGSVIVIAVLSAACGADAATTTDSAPAPVETTVTLVGPTTTVAEPTTTVGEPTTTDPPPTTAELGTTTTTTSTTSIPSTADTAGWGEPVDIGPVAGDVLAVVGVRHDDVLNLRAGPGVQHPVLAQLEPTAADVVAMGDTRSIPGALWIEVAADGVEGWVNLRYVAYLGDTTDGTAQIISMLGETPVAETMLELGSIVADAVAGASSQPEAAPVVSVAPTVGDLGEVTFDVLGFGDDSVRGGRLHIFGQPSESGDGFVLRSVEVTALCARGVSDGSCV